MEQRMISRTRSLILLQLSLFHRETKQHSFKWAVGQQLPSDMIASRWLNDVCSPFVQINLLSLKKKTRQSPCCAASQAASSSLLGKCTVMHRPRQARALTSSLWKNLVMDGHRAFELVSQAHTTNLWDDIPYILLYELLSGCLQNSFDQLLLGHSLFVELHWKDLGG